MRIVRRDFIRVGAGIGAIVTLPDLLHGSPADNAVVKATLPYAAHDGVPLLLDIYTPASTMRALPVIVFVHGGGWAAGTRATGPDFARFFASAGFAMVSIDYRLAPRHLFPAAVEDVKTAVRWLRANAAAHGLDKKRFGLWGTSAGGHLAAIAALSPADQFQGTGNLDQSSDVQCVLNAYGPSLFTSMDADTKAEQATLQQVLPALVRRFTTARPSMAAGQRSVEGGGVASNTHDSPTSAESRLLGAPIQTVPDRVRNASPLSYAHPNAPPFLLMHGLADDTVPRGQSMRLYNALANAGSDVTLRLIDGLPHTFFNRSDLDDIAAPFTMTVRETRRGGTERLRKEQAGVFPVAQAFFTQHLG